MPIGFDPKDIEAAGDNAYLFNEDDSFKFVYAGAMLPKSFPILKAFFEAIRFLKEKNHITNNKIKIYFIGTGKSPDDKKGYNIKPIAERYQIYRDFIVEYPARIPYLDVLAHLKRADVNFVLGSTEKHYTASKIFPAVFSKKPILAILRDESSAAKYLKESLAGEVITFREKKELEGLSVIIAEKIKEIINGKLNTNLVNYGYFDKFLAREQAKILAAKMNETLDNKCSR
jgi:hypothetical protein